MVFITVFDDADHKVRAFQAGERDYVAKPFQAEEVLARVQTHVHISGMERELREHNQRSTQANAQLEQLSTMRARSSAMLVHDLKSPLTVVGTALSPEVERDEDIRIGHGRRGRRHVRSDLGHRQRPRHLGRRHAVHFRPVLPA